LYATVPHGVSKDDFRVDPYILAAKMTDDSILAYHTALEVWGKAYSVYEQFVFLTKRSVSRPFSFQGAIYRGLSHPKGLQRAGQEHLYVEVIDRLGIDIKVACLERVLVDVLDRPGISGSWEEIWRSLESIEFFDLEKVVTYAISLKNMTTIAKVGFFLEQHKEALMVDEDHIARLLKYKPRSPHYMVRSIHTPGRLVSKWNLIVPEEILERVWEEI